MSYTVINGLNVLVLDFEVHLEVQGIVKVFSPFSYIF